MKKFLTECLMFLLLLCVSAGLAFSQTSALSGTVTDPSGAVVAGATVIAKNPAGGTEFKATTSDTGNYTIPSLSAGTYTVTISAQGFKQAVVNSVQILVATP
jgi:hypothetical protein